MFQLLLQARASEIAALEERLEELGACSISSSDADAGTRDETPLFGEPGCTPAETWDNTRLEALFNSEEDAQAAAAALRAQLPELAGQGRIHIRALAQQDWVRLTQSQFGPICITPQLWIVPSWHAAPAQAEAGTVIRLDPGLAFGTGTHPTTRMCLAWLARQELRGTRVLDYGCGSGILAIAAALLGAPEVDAVDLDPVAVHATADNARANGVSLRVGQPDLARGRYDIVLANILASPLKVLAPLLCGHLAAGGHLLLAGILQRQTQELQQAYRPWLQLLVADEQEGWVLLTARAATVK